MKDCFEFFCFLFYSRWKDEERERWKEREREREVEREREREVERDRERLSGKHGNARVHAASLASPALCLHFLSERESQWCENRSIEGGAGGGQRARGFLTGSRVTSNRDLDLDRSRSRFDVVGVGQLLSARSRLAKAFFFSTHALELPRIVRVEKRHRVYGSTRSFCCWSESKRNVQR